MTMDIRQSRLNLKINGHCAPNGGCDSAAIDMAQTKLEGFRSGKNSSAKRSFDVAFLMMPDEKLKTKQVKKAHSPTIDVESDSTQSTRSEDLSVKNGFSPIRPAEERNFNFDLLSRPRPHEGSPHLIHDLTANERLSYMLPGARFYENSSLMAIREKAAGNFLDADLPRSAFSKVTSITVSDSPIPPLSPDQQSCPSTSPPISISPGAPTGFRYDLPFVNLPNPTDFSRQSSPKSSKPMLYRGPQIPDPESIPQSYFPSPPFMPFAAAASAANGPEMDGMIRNPAAAAILSTLLPTAMTSFSLSAQNTCAKCNISFRMTSDLVYHMRSHHKNEHQQDPHRRKREEKLKCPVCNESFRERHHLTRHMTAHQDKAGDLLDPKKRSSAAEQRAQQQQQQQQHHHHGRS